MERMERSERLGKELKEGVLPSAGFHFARRQASRKEDMVDQLREVNIASGGRSHGSNESSSSGFLQCEQILNEPRAPGVC